MKPTVAVFFGGQSVEHEVSVISANQAMHAIDMEAYDVVPVYITKQGTFYSGVALFNIANYINEEDLLKQLVEVFFVRAQDGVYMEKTRGLFGRRIRKIDVAVPVVHGTNVEDGTLQGFLELLGLPYSGCDVASSALGMDKAVMKTVLKEAGVAVLDCQCFYKEDFYKDSGAVVEKLEKTIAYPMIVKPYNTGSSIGIRVAEDQDALIECIEYAADFAERILVEHAIGHLREINCSVLGDHTSVKASILEEPVSSGEILSYEDKYMSGGKGGKGTKGAKAGGSAKQGMASSDRKLPADLPDEKTEEIKEMALKTFRALGCSGVSRIDFLMDTDDNDKVYVNEINTIPGSLSFYLWEASGVSFSELMDTLIRLALKRKRERELLHFSFDSNILKNFGKTGIKGSKGK